VADIVHFLGCDVVPSDVWDIPVIGWVPTRRLPARVHKLLRCSRLSQRRPGEYEGVLRGRLELVSPPHEGAVRLPLKTDVQCVTTEPFGEIGDLEPD